MKFTKHQKVIIKKIASGEVKDIPTYIKSFNLSTFQKLNKKDIEERLKAEEKGKIYKKLKSGVNTLYTTFSNNDLVPTIHTIIPKEEDFEYVSADISYIGSSQIIKTNDSTEFKYNFFEGINVANSFSDIKDFLTIWQFLKSERLVLEVKKEITKADYEPFFEYKPIFKTVFGKTKAQKDTEGIISTVPCEQFKKAEVPFLLMYDDHDRIKDYRNYLDYNFEYNKANEIICSEFIDKQIYGNSGLDVFIKKGFRTNEAINIKKTLLPAYLSLFLTLGITVWQNVFNDNSDIIKIQNQLTEIQQIIENNEAVDLTRIEDELCEIQSSLSSESTREQLENTLQEIKELKKKP